MKPVLLLIPGTLGDERLWSDVTAALGPGVEVRLADVRRQDGICAMASDAWASLADVSQQARVFVAGFSLGGYVAIEMMARPRRALSGAGLVSTSARPEPPEARRMRDKTIAALQQDFAAAVAGTVAWCTHEASPDLTCRLVDMMTDVGAETAIRQTRAIMGRGDHRGALAAIDYPVRVLCGLQDRVTPPDLSRELADLMPTARLDLVDGAGHMLPVEQPAAVASALGELVASQSFRNDFKATILK